ncbi:MAG: hypothetical protein MJD61_11660 [Proteobacteria bacterium]|nr:hypothetical protein [Pseudomonadota bacterium]
MRRLTLWCALISLLISACGGEGYPIPLRGDTGDAAQLTDCYDPEDEGLECDEADPIPISDVGSFCHCQCVDDLVECQIGNTPLP